MSKKTPGRGRRPATTAESDARPDYFEQTRQSLLSRLRDWDDQESWSRFFQTYARFIFNIARKAGLSGSEAEEVVQETVLGVAKKMPEFRYDRTSGSFKGWLAQMTRWRIADQFRKRARQEAREIGADSQGEAIVEGLADPDETFERLRDHEWRTYILRLAAERVKREIHPRQFQMFELFAIQNWPMREITSMLSVNAAQVYMAKMRVARLIRSEVAALEREPP